MIRLFSAYRGEVATRSPAGNARKGVSERIPISRARAARSRVLLRFDRARGLRALADAAVAGSLARVLSVILWIFLGVFLGWRRRCGGRGATGVQPEPQLAAAQDRKRERERRDVVEQAEQEQPSQQSRFVVLPQRDQHGGVE